MTDAIHVIYDIYDTYDMYGNMTYAIQWLYVCQYGCQKKRYDFRNAANNVKNTKILFLWLQTEISCYLIFHLYFS